MSQENGRRKRPEIAIRQMEIDDVSAVYHLGEELFTSEELPILYRTWDPYEVTDHFTSDPDYCLVAEADGKIVGFVLATTVEKEGTAWKRYGYLSWIGIDKASQRSSLGLRLYRRLEERMREDGVRMIIADTEANNRGAISFFQALGFSQRRQHVWLAKTLTRPGKKVPEPGKSATAPSPGRPRKTRGERPDDESER
ncbi:MAG: GNAT family N-acetyltransferase [Chloroflexota bacterium]|nr:GNAT family N-acetyltransferase [Chloroflexota bacterium]